MLAKHWSDRSACALSLALSYGQVVSEACCNTTHILFSGNKIKMFETFFFFLFTSPLNKNLDWQFNLILFVSHNVRFIFKLFLSF